MHPHPDNFKFHYPYLYPYPNPPPPLADSELSEVLERRCRIAPSYASRMVEVMRELQRRRRGSDAFAGKYGLVTPRDLFRWAERGAVGYERLAADGFAVLGER